MATSAIAAVLMVIEFQVVDHDRTSGAEVVTGVGSMLAVIWTLAAGSWQFGTGRDRNIIGVLLAAIALVLLLGPEG